MPYTLDQLEAFVSSPAYDAQTAGLIAASIPAFKATDGELISPGVRRIRGNLCNVHGKYGPCDKALSGKKPKGGKRTPVKPKQTPEQRATARSQQRQANADSVAKRMQDSDTGLSPSGVAGMRGLASGTQPNKATGDGLVTMGLAEQASDGSYRMSATGRAAMNAMASGDYQRAVDTISRAGDTATSRRGRQATAATRQQDVAARRAAAQAKRELATRQRAEQATKKPAKAASGGSKKPEAQAVERPRAAKPAKRSARGSAPSVGSVGGSSPKPKPAAPKPEKAPVKQIAPALTEAAQSLSDGKELSDDDTQALIRNGLARLVKGALVLTAAGVRQTTKSFFIFKDASGRYRWVAQSSTAFQDRDKEIVSTKALSDDCRWADTHDNAYGPLRWWHTPGLDLGDCDFNAMHGRVLIESGTFRSPQIAQKVAAAASGLEISLGFVHLPSDPDADGVYHHIRRFERSLVPRGKASNRFTAFTVKEQSMANQFTPEKIAGMKAIGFTDGDIAIFSDNANATEKTADGMLVASKADEPAELPDLIINGITYKAFKPVEETIETVVEEDAIEDMPIEEEQATEGGALYPEDIAAIGQVVAEALQGAVAQIMGGLDLEKKVAGHVQGMLAPFQQAQTTKDAALAATAEQLSALTTKVDELTGDQPAAPYRASAAKDNVLTDAAMLAAVKQATDQNADPWADIKIGLGLSQPQ